MSIDPLDDYYDIKALQARIAKLEAQVVFEQSRAECHNRAAQEFAAGIQEFDRAVTCLALEVPEQVWNDVRVRWMKLYGLVSHD